MKTESIEYKDGDVTLRGFLAYDEAHSGRRPGVLVMPGGFGLGPNAKGRAEMLARLGYVALAGDPYGNGLEVDDLKEVMKLVAGLRADSAKFRQRARVALEKLKSLPQVDPGRIAAIGYCLGGTFVLELARRCAAQGRRDFSWRSRDQGTGRVGSGQGEAPDTNRGGRSDRAGGARQCPRRGNDEGRRGLANRQLQRDQTWIYLSGRCDSQSRVDRAQPAHG
jgi:dienelactone hydrolase